MEPDRYQQNHTLFIIGILSLISSISLFTFAAYLFPNLILGMRYHIPHFIQVWHSQLHLDYAVTPNLASWIIVCGVSVLGLVTAIVAYVTSNRIDSQIYAGEETAHHESTKKISATFSLTIRLVLIIILVFLAAQLLHWLIAE